jgi:hypothetical protein
VSNILNKNDVDLFYKLYSRLLCFVNKQAKLIQPDTLSPEKLLHLPLEDRIKIRDVFFEKTDLIDAFSKSEFAQHLTQEEIALIESWKHFQKDKFFIYKHLKQYSIFLSETKVFAVSGISDPLNEMFPYPPVLVEAILIPFQNRIIYDGLIRGYSVHFGSGFCSGMKSNYEKIKHNSGLITHLPLNEEAKQEKDDIENLKFYMKNRENREQYWDEICKLSSKSKPLKNLFHHEMGKIHAPHFSKQLKKLGIKEKWFGIIDDTIVASGATKKQLQTNLAEIVSSDYIERVYLFEI